MHMPVGVLCLNLASQGFAGDPPVQILLAHGLAKDPPTEGSTKDLPWEGLSPFWESLGVLTCVVL